MKQINIPCMDSKEIKAGIGNIKPIRRCNNNIPYLMENLNEMDIPIYLPLNWIFNSPEYKEVQSDNFFIIKDLKYTQIDLNNFVTKDIKMLSKHSFDGEISPTITEIYSQIPREHTTNTVAFEVLDSDKKQEGNCFLKSTIYHSFTVRLYRNKI